MHVLNLLEKKNVSNYLLHTPKGRLPRFLILGLSIEHFNMFAGGVKLYH